jgi:hypothetical protein
MKGLANLGILCRKLTNRNPASSLIVGARILILFALDFKLVLKPEV